MNDSDLLDFFKMADVFIMPSSQEGFGIVFIEAMACGTPVIAGNIDGSVDALRNGELGLLVNPFSTEEIAKAIDSILDNETIKSQNSQLERSKKVFEYFGFDQFVERQKLFIKELK